MNKLFTKIGVAFVGIAMAVGVGVAVGSNKESVPVQAADLTVDWNPSEEGELGTVISAVNGTDSGTISTGTFEWSYTRTLYSLTNNKSDFISFEGSSPEYWHKLGSGNACENLVFTTSAFKDMTIKSITVIALQGSNGARKLSISVSGNTYANCTNVTLNNATVYTSGSNNGKISSSYSDGTMTYSANNVVDTNGNITITLQSGTKKPFMLVVFLLPIRHQPPKRYQALQSQPHQQKRLTMLVIRLIQQEWLLQQHIVISQPKT